jgi:hypothetical protein
MQTPERLLPNLNLALRALRSAAVVLNGVETDEKLLPIMQNLTLAEVLGKRWILAVGGSQGAGKTSLMRALYKLDGEWLRPNEGRGEQRPVLIEESSSVKVASGFFSMLVKSDKTNLYELKNDVPAKNAEEFQKACRGEMPEVMLPVLKVPPTFFKGDGQAWMLLPGYEVANDENKHWQAMMRQVLIGAAGCVIVTNQTLLASHQQKSIVKDLLSKELSACKPLIVVSNTESYANAQDKLNEIKQAAIEVFTGSDAGLVPTVVCAGFDESQAPGYEQRWMPELKKALSDMSASGSAARQMQLNRLEGLLKNELNEAMNLVRGCATAFIASKTGGDTGANTQVKNCLEAFDDAAESLRREHIEVVSKILGKQLENARENLDRELINKHEGFWNKLGNFLDTATETQRALRGDVTSSWGHAGEILLQYVQELGSLTHKKLGNSAVSALPALPNHNVLKRLGYVGEGDNAVTSKFTDAEIHQNLAVLLRGEGQGTKTLEKTTQLLPVMALEYARIASALPEIVGVNAAHLEKMPEMDILASAKKVQVQFDQFKDISSGIIKGVAAMLAVDVAADGKIDTIPALFSALGMGGTSAKAAAPIAGRAAATTSSVAAGTVAVEGAIAGGTAATVAMSVAGVVAVGGLVVFALSQVRQHDKEVSSMAHGMLRQISDEHYSHFLGHFDGLMSDLRNHLKESLRRRYGLDQLLMEQDKLTKAMADVRILQRDLLGEFANSGQATPLFGR